MKKTLLISVSLLTLSVVTGIYAQTVAGTSLVDKMKAAAQNFTLSALLNPGETGLQSAPVKGKKTGDILTAGEWNRVLEIVSQGSAGGGSPMGKANLDTGWLNYYPTADPKFTDSAFVYGSKKLNFSDFTHNLGGNKDNYLVDVQYDQSEAGGGISEIPLHANNEDIVWHNLTNNSINLNNVHSPAVNIKVRIRIWDTSLASVSTNGAPAFYKCTNAQSLDATNTPCYGASRNGGAGTNQYRVVSCSNTDASGTYTAGGLLNFGDFITNKWSFHINNSNIACTDGSVLVMDIQGGGSSSSATPSNLVYINPENTDFAPLDCTPGVNYMITPITFSSARASSYTDKKLAVLKTGNWNFVGSNFFFNRSIDSSVQHTLRVSLVLDTVVTHLENNSPSVGLYGASFPKTTFTVPASKTVELKSSVKNASLYGGQVVAWCTN